MKTLNEYINTQLLTESELIAEELINEFNLLNMFKAGAKTSAPIFKAMGDKFKAGFKAVSKEASKIQQAYAANLEQISKEEDAKKRIASLDKMLIQIDKEKISDEDKNALKAALNKLKSDAGNVDGDAEAKKQAEAEIKNISKNDPKAVQAVTNDMKATPEEKPEEGSDREDGPASADNEKTTQDAASATGVDANILTSVTNILAAKSLNENVVNEANQLSQILSKNPDKLKSFETVVGAVLNYAKEMNIQGAAKIGNILNSFGALFNKKAKEIDKVLANKGEASGSEEGK